MRQSLRAPSAPPAGEASSPAVPSSSGAVERLDRLLAGKGLRLTPGRRAIVEAILARPGHFAIDDLVAELRARGLPASKATVYRALPLLTEAGILQPAVITGDERSYERAVGREHHDHLVCRGCGKVVEFEYEAIEVLQREVAARHGYALEGHMLQLLGRCPECQAGRPTSSRGESESHPTGGEE